MEDFHKAGGMPALLRELRPLLHLDTLTVSGRTLGEELDAAPPAFAQAVIRPFDSPIYPAGGLAGLRGNLAPGGATIRSEERRVGEECGRTGRSRRAPSK